ncbi:protein YdiK [Enterobacter cancerogenus]|uniref:Protein YdiK n=1 Tax=Enterobacter cancerogenus TaxID=69218 RepID=A0A484XLK2_9ENTR|nr:protein YdiK [Enterobacter cancerogenus]
MCSSPYFSAILWAAILTIIFNPVKNKLRTALGERNGLASFLTLCIICLIVFIPLTVILSSLAIELNVGLHQAAAKQYPVPGGGCRGL